MNRFIAGFSLALAVTGAVAFAAPAPAPTSTTNAAVMVRAKEWFHRIATGDIDRSQLTSLMNSQLTDAMIKQVSAQVAPLGEPTSFVQVQSGREKGADYFVYAVTFPSGDKWNYLFVYEPSTNKVSGLKVTPAAP